MRGAALDRRVRRPRRRRLRRVRAAHPARARRTSRGRTRGDSQRFHDGSFARTPIAPVEVQGYVYDAKLRIAELAREVWRDRAARRAARARGGGAEAHASTSASGSTSAAATTRSRSTARSGRSTRSARTSATCSGAGSCPAERVDAVVDQLMGEELWSGWGVRTMSSGDAGYNPLAYHNGTVWPHDNSLIALGPRPVRALARGAADRAADARRGARTSTTSCPRCSPACRATETPFPIAYPTAARPQAWAAGTPVLLLQVLLGLQPDRRRGALDHPRARGAALVGRPLAAPVRHPRLRPRLGRACRATAVSRLKRHEDRHPEPAVVPGAADRLRRDRVDRLAARRRARRRTGTT